MASVVPSGTADPDGDRRFDGQVFPLLEPVGWRGEGHRGGYGVADPGSITTSLGLIFGPQEAGGTDARLSVSVGDRLLTDLRDRDPYDLLSLSARLGRPFAQADLRVDALRHEPVTTATIAIENESVEFSVFRVGSRWIAQDRWRRHAVEIEGSGVEPTDVALQLAAGPSPWHSCPPSREGSSAWPHSS